MSLNILSYNYVSEISAKLNSIVKNFSNREKNLRFVVPSRKDKQWFPEKFSNYGFNLWTWNEIYDDVCGYGNSKRKRVLSPPDHLLILNSILNDSLNECSEKVKELPGLKRQGFLSVISGDIRELLNEAVKPEQLTLNLESDDPFEFLLPAVYERYLKYLDDYSLLDSSQICSSALEEILINKDWGKNLILIFVGFMSFNHSQLELVRAIDDRCSDVFILKPEANLTDFHDVDIQFNMTRGIIERSEKSSGNVIEFPVAEPGLEPEALARTLALYFNEGKLFSSFDEIGIMISEGREAAFIEAFERYKIPYNLTSGITIDKTLPGKILTSIKNLRSQNFPAYETGMLLTQSCFAGIKFPVMRAYRSGHSGLNDWEKYLTERADDPDEILTEIFKTALTAIQSIKKFCSALSRSKRPAEIMKSFYEFLKTENLWLDRENKISDFPELDENFRFTASAIQTVGEKVLAFNELIPDLGAIQDKKLKGDEAFEYLERWCSNSYIRAPIQISNAVRIFTGRPPVLSHFRIWIMTDVTYKAWSGIITGSPLLGNSEREKLALNKAFLPMTPEKATQREALFRRLIQTGEKLTIIFRPELDEEGRPLSESPFMERFFEDLNEWKRNIKESEGIKILLDGDNFIFPEIDPQGKNFRTSPKILKNSRAVGASDIKELLGCPFLWWQKRHAKLYEQSSEIVSPVEWGNMLHKFWERVWTRYRVDMNLSGKSFLIISNDEWKKLLNSEIEDYEKYSRLVNDFRLRRKLNGINFRVERLSLLQADIIDKFHSEGWKYEKILLENEAQLKIDFDGKIFLGQCDRIEILNTPSHEKTAFIIDYKEGKGENYESSMKIGNHEWNFERRKKFSYGLQLSVYAAMFDKIYDCGLSGVYILGLEDGKISGSFKGKALNIFDDYKSEKFNEKILLRIDEGNYAVKCASEILKKGEFSPEYQSELCRFCSIKSVCRKGELQGESLQSSEN